MSILISKLAEQHSNITDRTIEHFLPAVVIALDKITELHENEIAILEREIKGLREIISRNKENI